MNRRGFLGFAVTAIAGAGLIKTVFKKIVESTTTTTGIMEHISVLHQVDYGTKGTNGFLLTAGDFVSLEDKSICLVVNIGEYEMARLRRIYPHPERFDRFVPAQLCRRIVSSFRESSIS